MATQAGRASGTEQRRYVTGFCGVGDHRRCGTGKVTNGPRAPMPVVQCGCPCHSPATDNSQPPA